jgi:RNA polymerase sigma-70 factor (ECF subfamily)
MKRKKIRMSSKKKEFVQRLERNKGIILKIAYLYSDSKEDRKDLIQEIYFQLWKSFESFKNNSQFSTWLYRVALNTAISQIRKKKKINIHEEDYKNMYYNSDTLKSTQTQKLFDNIAKLNQIDKAIILLWLEGRKYEEIAEILGMTVSNISVKLVRIKNQLKEMINGKDYE